jgi:hypothetical protein
VLPPESPAWFTDADSPPQARSFGRSAVVAAVGAVLVVVALIGNLEPDSRPSSQGVKHLSSLEARHLHKAAGTGKGLKSAKLSFKSVQAESAIKAPHASARHSPTSELHQVSAHKNARPTTAADRYGSNVVVPKMKWFQGEINPPAFRTQGLAPTEDFSSEKERDVKTNLAGYKVKVRLYMESQCPACKKFSTTYLKQMLASKAMREIVDFKFVPWGNALIQDGNTKEMLNTTALLERTLHQFVELSAQIQEKNQLSPLQKMLTSLETGISSAWSSLNKEMSALNQLDSIAHAAEAKEFAHAAETKEPHAQENQPKEDPGKEAELSILDRFKEAELLQLNFPLTSLLENATNNETKFSSEFEKWWAAQPRFDMNGWLESVDSKNRSESRSKMQASIL